MSKKYIYVLGGVVVVGIAAYMIFSGPPKVKVVTENMNRDITAFKVVATAHQQHMDAGTFTEEERAQFAVELADFGKKMENYRTELGESWADFSARFGDDLAGFQVKLLAIQAELAKGNLSAETRAELSTELELMAKQVQSYQSEIK